MINLMNNEYGLCHIFRMGGAWIVSADSLIDSLRKYLSQSNRKLLARVRSFENEMF